MRFTQVMDSGLTREFTGRFLTIKHPDRFAGGIAAADYDGDGDVDLYVVGGHNRPNHLYRNQGDGTFVEVAGKRRPGRHPLG